MKTFDSNDNIKKIGAYIYLFSDIREIWTFVPEKGIEVWDEIKRRNDHYKKKFKKCFNEQGMINIWRIK